MRHRGISALARQGVSVGCPGLLSLSDCMNHCIEFGSYAPECVTEYDAMNQCDASTPAGAGNWECIDGYPYPTAPGRSDTEHAYHSFAYGFDPLRTRRSASP